MKIVEEKIDFIKEFSVINKNKFTIRQTKSMYLGLLFELISSKEVFKRNIELKDFLKLVFNLDYSDYLFKARPLLAARLMKDVSNKYHTLEISKSINSIIYFLEEKKEIHVEVNSKKIKSTLEDDIVNWFSSVNKGTDKS